MATQCFQSTSPQYSPIPLGKSLAQNPISPHPLCLPQSLRLLRSHKYEFTLASDSRTQKCHHCWTAIHHNSDSTSTWKWTSSTTGPNLMGIQGVGLTYQPQERDLFMQVRPLYSQRQQRDNSVISPNLSDYAVISNEACSASCSFILLLSQSRKKFSGAGCFMYLKASLWFVSIIIFFYLSPYL